jgi:hypothetical protein
MGDFCSAVDVMNKFEEFLKLFFMGILASSPPMALEQKLDVGDESCIQKLAIFSTITIKSFITVKKGKWQL